LILRIGFIEWMSRQRKLLYQRKVDSCRVPVKGGKLQETSFPRAHNVAPLWREYKSRFFSWIPGDVPVMVGQLLSFPSPIVNETRHGVVYFSGGLNFYDSTARRWRMHRPKKSCFATRPDVLALSFAWKIGVIYPKSHRDQLSFR